MRFTNIIQGLLVLSGLQAVQGKWYRPKQHIRDSYQEAISNMLDKLAPYSTGEFRDEVANITAQSSEVLKTYGDFVFPLPIVEGILANKMKLLEAHPENVTTILNNIQDGLQFAIETTPDFYLEKVKEYIKGKLKLHELLPSDYFESGELEEIGSPMEFLTLARTPRHPRLESFLRGLIAVMALLGGAMALCGSLGKYQCKMILMVTALTILVWSLHLRREFGV
ncbi:uncharacterized protein KNAG_0H01615 [Huiozyma naganishii CBS 8797]|uniref:Uncharacterized protein n=1 Tax=Huiozyma naganishii (strain ATCC MYA-139 / BCRC 22969 / CBS 8797 / KCTC 17520 / NBRC 10181 / NCYC 3082 / Yp74L-3) TaxID=1071383 RepID=J7S9M0_HUIN7|nr:hypothetical protein KNAG_0H01615 [Kazachstania naganishii CBS 8797]CCK71576.1 hypothetical protein KNAG_0H01615 [Kazachstania naganishii CBS 8797]